MTDLQIFLILAALLLLAGCACGLLIGYALHLLSARMVRVENQLGRVCGDGKTVSEQLGDLQAQMRQVTERLGGMP